MGLFRKIENYGKRASERRPSEAISPITVGGDRATLGGYADIWRVYLPQVANMAIAAAVMAAVAIQPMMRRGLDIWMKRPITRRLENIIMMRTMIGTAAMPLAMAAQTRAFMGFRGVRIIPAPSRVAIASTP